MNGNSQNIEFNTQNIIENFKQNWLLIIVVIAAIIIFSLIITIISRKLKIIISNKITDEKIEIKKRVSTIVSVFSNLTLILIVLIFILILADILGINIVPILTGAGVLGIIIGFGAQNLIKDLINGIFILAEQWFQVDDIITVGNISGVVEKFNLRTTVVRDLGGKAHFIPNGQITILSNSTYKWSRAVIDVSVSYKEDTERVIGVLEEIFDDFMKKKEYKKFILERPCILGDGGINELSDSAVIFKIAFKVKPPNQWTIERQLRKMIKSKFDESGIEIPYPSRNIYIKKENR